MERVGSEKGERKNARRLHRATKRLTTTLKRPGKRDLAKSKKAAQRMRANVSYLNDPHRDLLLRKRDQEKKT